MSGVGGVGSGANVWASAQQPQDGQWSQAVSLTNKTMSAVGVGNANAAWVSAQQEEKGGPVYDLINEIDKAETEAKGKALTRGELRQFIDRAASLRADNRPLFDEAMRETGFGGYPLLRLQNLDQTQAHLVDELTKNLNKRLKELQGQRGDKFDQGVALAANDIKLIRKTLKTFHTPIWRNLADGSLTDEINKSAVTLNNLKPGAVPVR
jgi:hypothetical protein